MKDTVRTSGESLGRPATLVARRSGDRPAPGRFADPRSPRAPRREPTSGAARARRGPALGATFDTTVFVTGAFPASGTIDYWVGGAVVDSAAFSVPARGHRGRRHAVHTSTATEPS